MKYELGKALPEDGGREFKSFYVNWDMMFREETIKAFCVPDFAGTMLHKKWSPIVKHLSIRPKAHYAWDSIGGGFSTLPLHQEIRHYEV